MILNGIDFDLKEQNNLWVLAPAKKLEFEEFKSIMAIVKARNGFYNRALGFVFNSKPDFESVILETAPVNKEKKVTKTVEVKKTASKEELAALIADAQIVLEKANAAEAARKEKAKGFTAEIYPPATFDECKAFLDGLRSKEEYSSSHDHMETLALLEARCKDDEELRANLTYKDYYEMLRAGAMKVWQKSDDKKKFEFRPSEIIDSVIEEYKTIKTTPIKKQTKAKTSKKTAKK